MATLKLGEELIDGTIAKLKTYLPARLAAINSEKSDGIEVAPPEDADYIVGGTGPIARTPLLIVTEGSGDFAGEGAHGMILGDEILVFVVDGDPDRSKLARKLLRHQRAIIEAIWDDDPKERLNGSAHRIVPVRHEPGPVFDYDNDASLWRAGRVVVFRAELYESD